MEQVLIELCLSHKFCAALSGVFSPSEAREVECIYLSFFILSMLYVRTCYLTILMYLACCLLLLALGGRRCVVALVAAAAAATATLLLDKFTLTHTHTHTNITTSCCRPSLLVEPDSSHSWSSQSFFRLPTRFQLDPVCKKLILPRNLDDYICDMSILYVISKCSVTLVTARALLYVL